MALLTATDGEPQFLCTAAHLGSPLGGMVPMYLLMSALHSGPWLKMIWGRPTGASRAFDVIASVSRRSTRSATPSSMGHGDEAIRGS